MRCINEELQAMEPMISSVEYNNKKKCSLGELNMSLNLIPNKHKYDE